MIFGVKAILIGSGFLYLRLIFPRYPLLYFQSKLADDVKDRVQFMTKHQAEILIHFVYYDCWSMVIAITIMQPFNEIDCHASNILMLLLASHADPFFEY
jgi:hypothetical protein